MLSGNEVWGGGTSNQILKYDTATSNTRQSDYYKSKGVTTNNHLEAKKQYTSSSSNWWLRTSISDVNTGLWAVSEDGSDHYNVAGTKDGFAPSFRIG